jgi:adenylate kinase family enzyme
VTGAGRIILIGGPRGAGKTVAAVRLARALGMAAIRLDRYYVHYLSITKHDEKALSAARLIAHQLMVDLSAGSARAVVEGGWLMPRHADALRRDFGVAPVFLGYPDAWPRARLQKLRDGGELSPTGRVHNIAWRDEAEALEIIGRQIGQSRWQRDICAELGIPYIDTSDFAKGDAALGALFDVALPPLDQPRTSEASG